MARKPRPAKIERLARALRRAYKKPLRSRQGGIFQLALTEEQIQEVLDLARPLYAIVNNKAPFPSPIDDRELEEYTAFLQRLFNFRHLQLIPDSLAHGHSLLVNASDGTQQDLTGMIADKHWLWMINLDYDQKRLEKILDNLHPEVCWCTPPDDYEARVVNFTNSLINKWFHHCLRVPPEDEMIYMVLSYAQHLATPEDELPRPQREKKLERIRAILKYFPKWPVLGYKPGDPTTLCILVK